MNTSFAIYNFIAGTCILVVVAYLLVRGRMLSVLFRENLNTKETLLLGLVMGLVGLVEAVFPNAGLPYATHTLFVIFAAIVGGLRVGLVAAGVVTIGAVAFQTHEFVIPTMLAVIISAFLGKLVRSTHTTISRLIAGFAVGAIAQACRLLLRMALTIDWSTNHSVHLLWISAPANGFGIALLLLVVSDAQVRAQSERAQALVAQAQLTALRARMRPHFLFNTLNSIAELCNCSPTRAEAAILRLSSLMRHALETSAETSTCLVQEIAAASEYIEIERERIGDRMSSSWQLDKEFERIPVPPFCVQTLAENAIHHGLALKKGAVEIRIIVRVGARHTMIAVEDDGLGMTNSVRREALAEVDPPMHGLQILTQHLILLYGRRARLRLYTREGAGTLAAFFIPVGHHHQAL